MTPTRLSAAPDLTDQTRLWPAGNLGLRALAGGTVQRVREEPRMDRLQAQATWSSSSSGASPPLAWHQREPLKPIWTYAGFWQRFLANLIDGVVLSVVNYPLSSFLNEILASVFDVDPFTDSVWLALSVSIAASLLLPTLLAWLYYAVLESSSRQATLGKRALGITVTDLEGGRISFGRATGRFFAHYISALLLLLGFLIQPFTPKRQALHDMIAGTLVVRR